MEAGRRRQTFSNRANIYTYIYICICVYNTTNELKICKDKYSEIN
jgi:hypothetical protein